MSDQSISGTKSPIELRKMYGVSFPTWQKWLEKVPDLKLISGQRVYTPAQVEKIVNHLGNP